jgi:hypothetical protein
MTVNALTLPAVVGHAPPVVLALILALIGLTLAAAIVASLKLAAGAHLNGGSAFLSNLRWGGPMLGGLGAAYGALNMAIGVSNQPGEVPLHALAPGLAEMALMLGLGFLCGVMAVIANAAVEARIDRAVLGS